MSNTYLLLVVVIVAACCFLPCYAAVGNPCTSDDQSNCTTSVEVCGETSSTCVCISSTHYEDGNVCHQKINAGQPCSSTGPNDQCVDNSACDGTTCTCNTGYYNKEGVCSAKINAGQPCSSTGPNDQCVDNSACDGTTCTCNTGYYNKEGVCSAKINAGQPCSSTGPNDQCVDNSACDGTTCTCNTGYYNKEGVCSAKINAGQPCSSTGPNDQCVDNSACDGTTCTCNTGYYNKEGVCSAKINAGQPCSSTGPNDQCVDNSACDGTTCTCNTGYYNKEGVCSAKINAGQPCSSTGPNDQCVDNSACDGTTCTCNTGYYNKEGVCSAKINAGQPCSSTGPNDQCVDNSACDGTTCTCNTGYYNKEGVCSAKINAGQPCSSTGPNDQCVDNSACDGTTCTCNTGYYNKEGVCSAKINAGQPCSSTGPNDQCVDNSACDGTTCTCNTGYYNKEGVCSAKINAGQPCSSTGPNDQCVDNSACDGTTCTCNTGYYNKEGVCSAKINAGQPCSSTGPNDQCVDNSACDGTTCTCNTGYYNKEGVCSAKINAGQPCSSTGPNDQCVDNSACDGTTCTCNTGYYNKEGVCSAKINAGQPCSSTGPNDQCVDNSACDGTTCTCNTGYYNKEGVCSAKINAGQPCSSTGPNDQCVDNSACDGTTCTCNTGYYNKEGVCSAKINAGQPCSSTGPNDQCVDNSACDGTTCTCNTGYYNKEGVCSAKIDAGQSCTDQGPADQCVDNSACVSTKCTCNAGYYNNGGVCNAKIDAGQSCTDQGPADQCVDNSACDGTTCTCNAGYYNNGGVCNAKVNLGGVCLSGQPPDQCAVTNSECIADSISNYKCLCKAGYYANSQSCRVLSELKVANLAVPDTHTTETYFLVTWTKPSTYTSITKYQLVISSHIGSEAAVDILNTSVTQYNVTSRIPGRKYTITLKSIETKSRPTPQETYVSVIDGSRPAAPGNIVANALNAPTLSLSWSINGDIEYLSGTVNDTGVNPQTFNQSAVNLNSPTITFSNLKPGQPYTFTTTAHSNNLDSMSRTETIRTVPTQPDPPDNFKCTDTNIYDTSMLLTWDEPSNPNGYIQYYIIYEQNTGTLQTNGSVTEHLIINLQPETYYYFKIATVNDAASSYVPAVYSLQCRTKTRLASMPINARGTVTHNALTATWDSPSDPGGQILAYRLTVMNATTENDKTCSLEIVLWCTTCVSQAPPFKTPSCALEHIVNRTVEEINGTDITYTITNLSPFVKYSVKIQAVNAEGSGNPSMLEKTTLQTGPEKPINVTASNDSNDPKRLYLLWQQPLPRPGITNYTIDVYEADDTGTGFIKKPVFGKTITGYYTQSAVIDGLEEYWEYKFEVTASTVIGSVKSDQSAAFRTYHARPGSVVDFTVDNPVKIYTQMVVKWKIPPIRERNSIIQKYKLIHNITGADETVTIPSNNESNHQQTFNVTAEEYYKIQILAVNTENQDGTVETVYYQAQPGPPIVPSTPAVDEDKSKPVISQTTITVKFDLSWFSNTENGQRTDEGFILCPAETCDDYGYKDDLEAKAHDYFSDKSKITTWKKSKALGFKETYRITNSTWIQSYGTGRRRRSTHDDELVIGEETDCDKRDENEYCNGPLPPATSFIVVAFVCSAGGCTESEQFGPYTTQQIPDDDFPIAIVAGAVAAVVVAFIVIIIVIVIIRARRVPKHKKMSEEKEPEDFGGHVLETPSVERKNIKLKRPVRMREFAAKVEELHKDSNLKFAHEYEKKMDFVFATYGVRNYYMELKVLTDPKTMKGVTSNLAESEQNKLKNRYVNILPYDQTIVKLLPLIDDDGDDTTFINANYIPGYSSQREYIATQGPIPSTIDDFWRMVWEQNVSIIVMLTLCKEDGRIKCECYFPMELNEVKQYGDLVVETSSCSTINTYDFRIFKFSMGDKTRTVKHFHFFNWRDFSADVKNDVLVDFIANVRSHMTVQESHLPMIVHCSAGVGRTGTFIAVDHMMQFITDHDWNATIDIFDLVHRMRKCRNFMVQTEQQYIFIHDCVKDLLDKKKKKEQADEENIYVNNGIGEENIYENKAFDAEEPSLYSNVQIGQRRTDL